MKRFKGKTALVTGASSGMGKDIAILLAETGCHLVLVARREDRLLALKHELERKHAITVHVRATDLADLTACAALVEQLDREAITVDILVNNAGFGYGGAFVGQSWERQQEMLRVNIEALTFLTMSYAQKMAAKGAGDILLVSSVGGFSPCPGLAIYDASKAYVLVLGESLHYELKSKGVVVTTLCPGATKTEFFDVSGQTLSFAIKNTMMPSRTVAKMALQCLASGRMHAIPGLLNKLAVWSLRLVPRCHMPAIAHQSIKAFK